MGNLRDDIQRLLNSYNAETGSNTPDFILAEYLVDCLAAFDKAAVAREKWHNAVPPKCNTIPGPNF